MPLCLVSLQPLVVTRRRWAERLDGSGGHLRGQLIEHGDHQSGKMLEDDRVLPQIVEPRDHTML